MRQARAWVTGEFWPATAEDFFAWRRTRRPAQRVAAAGSPYWRWRGDGAARGVSAELFVDCNSEGFFMLAKFAPFWKAYGKESRVLMKTAELVNRFSAASLRYEAGAERMWKPAQQLPAGRAHGQYSYPPSLKETRNLGESLLMCIRPSQSDPNWADES